MRLEESYARALFESVKGKGGREINAVLKKFFLVVRKNGHIGLLSRIASAFEKYEARQAKKNIVNIYVKKGAKKTIPKEVISVFEKGKIKPEYKPCEDETIIGGYVVKGMGMRVDGSYKGALMSLYGKIKS